MHFISQYSGPGSSVGIATAYGLDGPGIESRWGARFSAPVQTGPEAHTASCTMCTASFPRVRCGQGVTLTPHPLLVPRSKSIAIPVLSLRAFVAYEGVKPTISQNNIRISFRYPLIVYTVCSKQLWSPSSLLFKGQWQLFFGAESDQCLKHTIVHLVSRLRVSVSALPPHMPPWRAQ
jgi:hypothetical protein